MNDYLKDNISKPGDLAAAVHGFGRLLEQLNGAAAGSADAVAEDIKAVNEQFNRLSNTMLAAISAGQRSLLPWSPTHRRSTWTA